MTKDFCDVCEVELKKDDEYWWVSISGKNDPYATRVNPAQMLCTICRDKYVGAVGSK